MAVADLIQIQAAPARGDVIDLTVYDWIVLNTSGGKDSSVMAWHVAELAKAQGVADRLVMVQATFPEEWQDAEAITRDQAKQLGVPLHVVTRGEALLTYVRRRGMWPSNKQRYCTSDFKRAPIRKFINHLPGQVKGKRQRVLNVMGLRAQESPARAKKVAFQIDEAQTNGRRRVDQWLPIFRLSEADIWATIRENSIPTHRAYSLGFTRLSCRICIFANRNTLLAAAQTHPELFKEYVDVEKSTGHMFRQDQSLAEVWTAYQNGETPSGPLDFGKGL